MSATLNLAKQLIEITSVTPEDGGCQDILAQRLKQLGFTIEHLPFGDVKNLWATSGDSSPILAFAGHTDVVPAGPLENWHTEPFKAIEQDGYLLGRGAADMKGSLAAMITAAERFLSSKHQLNGSLAFLITSDEEGHAVDGIRKVVEEFQRRGQHIEFCLVGEPSCSESLGDTLRIGRRGSLSGTLTVKGMGGHIAYWQRADNPIHKVLPALHKLTTTTWDSGDSPFPPTSFQISNIHGGVGANNVIPETVSVEFNLRYSTELVAKEIEQQVESILDEFGLEYQLNWHLSGEPFLTEGGKLIEQATAAITEITGIEPEHSTGGGTSDGRFIAKLGTQVVEFGPCNGTIHKPNEMVSIDDLEKLSTVYERIMRAMLWFA